MKILADFLNRSDLRISMWIGKHIALFNNNFGHGVWDLRSTFSGKSFFAPQDSYFKCLLAGLTQTFRHDFQSKAILEKLFTFYKSNIYLLPIGILSFLEPKKMLV